MVVTRLTVELLRPVPIAPLRIVTRLGRPGKKVQVVEASLVVVESGTEVARATGLRMRRGRVLIPEGAAAMGSDPRPASGAESRPPWAQHIQYEGYRFINPDLTIYLHRHPIGEWVALEATTAPEALGVGLAESRLYDERGPIGRSLQSLLIERD